MKKQGNYRDNEGYRGEFQATRSRSVCEVFLAPGTTWPARNIDSLNCLRLVVLEGP